MSASPLIVRGENSQVITDLPSKLFLDLPAAGNSCGRACSSCGRACSRIAVDGVIAAFANKHAAMRFDMPDEVGTFHSIVMRSVITLHVNGCVSSAFDASILLSFTNARTT